jgi:tartrate-resistant acid phosphatase type 5
MLHLSELESRLVPARVRFAVVGDYGVPAQQADDVAQLIRSWSPDAVVTTGDNNYPVGSANTIEANIGNRYREFFAPSADGQPRFLPVLGNHDWDTPNAKPYLDYFTLPGNERYYTSRRGPVEFFVLDSDPREPDGITSTSQQGEWLKTALANSTATWKVVAFHHPPFSSSSVHGSTPALQWPFQQWGADLVLNGHDHTYERIEKDGFPYIVNGAGGQSLYPFASQTVEGSTVRYNGDYGAILADATEAVLTFQFVTRRGVVIDSRSVTKPNADDGTRVAVGAGNLGGPAVQVRDGSGKFLAQFFAYDPNFRGGVRVAVGDVNRDGISDIITTPGVGGGPHVRVLDGRTLQELSSFFAFDSTLRGGLNVASGDINNDGYADIVTAPASQDEPRVRVFSGKDGTILQDFLAEDPSMRTGLTLATGNFDSNPMADIAVGSTPSSGPRARIFSGSTSQVLRTIPVSDPAFRGGVYVSPVSTNATTPDDLLLAAGPGGEPRLRRLDSQTGVERSNSLAYESSFSGGVLSAGSSTELRAKRVLLGAGLGGGPHVRILTPDLQPVLDFFAFESTFRGGVFVGIG